ncbi:serine/threonine protein kinase [Streptomycetaceae bacterium NBC_01309]
MTEDAANRRRVGDGRFELVERLGSGAMGTVWRAVDTTLHREVALKEVRAPHDAPADDLALLHARVLREAQALARLRNPHVATVHQIVDDDPFPWIVMELVPGRSLTSLLAERTLTPPEAAGIGADVLDALAAAHSAGVLHRDVKPANVLVRPDGRAVLVDFGIAAVEGTATVTGVGSFVGTIEYIAPERTEGRRPTPASDLWSLGVLLYVAVEGRSPFQRASQWGTLTAIVTEPHPPPRQAGRLAGLIDALLAKNPEERPTAADLAGPLAEIASGTPDQASPAAATTVAAAPAVPGGREEFPTVTSAPPPRPAFLPTVGVVPPPHGPVPGPTRAPGPGPARPGRARRLVVAGVIGAVLAGGGTAVGLALAGDDSDDGNRPNSQGTPTPTVLGTTTGTGAGTGTGTGAATPPTTATSAPPPGSAAAPPPSPTTTPPTATATTPGAPTGPQLPAGYQLQSHSSGFEVAVPVGWRLTQDGSGNIAYAAPDGNHRLVVRVLRGDTADPYAEQAASARETQASASYPGYAQIALTRGTFGGGASATWEYTYTSPDGPRHIKDIRWRVGGTSYNLWIAVPDGPSWPQYQQQLDIALQHFRDTRAG